MVGGTVKTALFLIGVLADRLREQADKSRKIEVGWREKSEALEASLPDPAERTVEQWESLVEMAGELYYSIAASSHAGSAARHAENLVEALSEVEKNGR